MCRATSRPRTGLPRAPDGSTRGHRPAVTDPQDPQELRRRAFGALRELLARVGDRKPLVPTIDDLQWGDLDSAVAALRAAPPARPPVLMLLFAYRSEYADGSQCLAELLEPGGVGLPESDRRVVPVGPLAEGDVRRTGAGLFRRDDPAAALKAETIVRESGGSPYFAVELARYLSDLRDDGDEGSSFEITLDRVLWRRITRFSAPPRGPCWKRSPWWAGPCGQFVACRASGLGPEGYSALGLLRGEHMVRGSGPGVPRRR